MNPWARLLLIIALLSVAVKCDDEGGASPNEKKDDSSDAAEDAGFAMFDKSPNGKLSVDSIVTAMRNAAHEGGLDYGPGYYNIIRSIVSAYLDETGELNRTGAKLMEKSISDGAYNQLFADFFKDNPPLPLKQH